MTLIADPARSHWAAAVWSGSFRLTYGVQSKQLIEGLDGCEAARAVDMHGQRLGPLAEDGRLGEPAGDVSLQCVSAVLPALFCVGAEPGWEHW